jgi:hypothetical protein
VRESRDPFSVAPKVHTLALNANNPTRMPGPSSLSIIVNQAYSILPEEDEAQLTWRVRNRGYVYSIQTADESEVVAFHWNPESAGEVASPHAHVGRRLLSEPIELGSERFDLPKIHIPTGRVPLEDVVRMAITEFRVEPRRDDWQAILNES